MYCCCFNTLPCYLQAAQATAARSFSVASQVGGFGTCMFWSENVSKTTIGVESVDWMQQVFRLMCCLPTVDVLIRHGLHTLQVAASSSARNPHVACLPRSYGRD